MPKQKKVQYKPPIAQYNKQLQRTKAKAIAADVAKVQAVAQERAIVKLVVKGHSYDEVSERTGISTNEAHKIVQSVVDRWIREESLDVQQLKEIMGRQIDAVLALAMNEAFPHPMSDPTTGKPLYDKMCDCDYKQEDGTCIIDKHNERRMSQPSIQWAHMIESILDRKAKFLGLDAAQKLEQQKVDIMKRVYEGVDSKVIEQL